jgi:hypothetical protein
MSAAVPTPVVSKPVTAAVQGGDAEALPLPGVSHAAAADMPVVIRADGLSKRFKMFKRPGDRAVEWITGGARAAPQRVLGAARYLLRGPQGRMFGG